MMLLLKDCQSRLMKNDSCITMTEDEVLHHSLQKENTSTDKLNTKDNQQLCTKQRESTNVESISTESYHEDTELVEEQAAVNHMQELTGDPFT